MGPCPITTAPTVGEAISLPPGNGPECLDEWYLARRGANSPDLISSRGIVPRGRMISSPTVAGQSFYCAGTLPGCTRESRTTHQPGAPVPVRQITIEQVADENRKVRNRMC